MKCKQCDAETNSAAVYCHQCGARLDGSTSRVSPREQFTNSLNNQDDDPEENELWQGQFSRRAMIGSWVGAAVVSVMLLILASASGFTAKGWGVCVALIICLWVGLFVRLLYRQLSEHYYLTNRRFIHERGILWRVIDRVEAIDIDDVSYQQGPVERVMGVGTIKVRSSDSSDPELELHGIEKVSEVAEMIDEVRRQERRKRGLHIEAV